MNLSGDRNQCAGCGEFFNSSFAFDRHRIGEHEGNQRRCMTIDEMIARGMSVSSSGFWITSTMPQKLIEEVTA